VSEGRQGALEHTRRLLEAQHNETTGQENLWRALSLQAGDVPILVPINNIVELAVCENITPVPLTHPWVRGLTNLRGQLYTVVDLSVLIGGVETRLSRDARIVVLSDGGLNSCLLVNDVTGLKVFAEDQPRSPATGIAVQNSDYFTETIHSDDAEWIVLDVGALVRDDRFQDASRVKIAPL
jgi:twitching motility protein PilI